MPAGASVGLVPAPLELELAPATASGLDCELERVGVRTGVLVLMESERVTVWVRGEGCGIVSAEGCSVPIEVTSEALPALERA